MIRISTLLASASIAMALGACTAPTQERAVIHGDCTVSPCQASGQRSVLIQGDYQVVATPVVPTAAPAPAHPPRKRPVVKPATQGHCTAGGCGARTYLAGPPPGIQATPPAMVPCAGPCGARPTSTQPTNVQYYYAPRVDCKASGGVEGINPATGRPTCVRTVLVLPGEQMPPWVKK